MPKYPYPTNIDFTNGTDNLFVYLNTVTNQWFSNMILITIYIIIATGFYLSRRDVNGSMAVAGFVTFIIGLLLWTGGMLSGVAFAIVIAVAIIGFASLWIDLPD